MDANARLYSASPNRLDLCADQATGGNWGRDLLVRRSLASGRAASGNPDIFSCDRSHSDFFYVVRLLARAFSKHPRHGTRDPVQSIHRLQRESVALWRDYRFGAIAGIAQRQGHAPQYDVRAISFPLCPDSNVRDSTSGIAKEPIVFFLRLAGHVASCNTQTAFEVVV